MKFKDERERPFEVYKFRRGHVAEYVVHNPWRQCEAFYYIDHMIRRVLKHV
jgi:hypothetical protein